MKSAILQEKMAAGLKNREFADAAALTILRAGENYLHTYYQISNNTLLSPGIGPVVEARSLIVRNFKSNRNLNDGFTHPDGVNIGSYLGAALDQEPKYIIEYINPAGSGVFGEFDDDSSGSSSGGLKIQKYRIISKATDTTGNMYTGFESVVSVAQ